MLNTPSFAPEIQQLPPQSLYGKWAASLACRVAHPSRGPGEVQVNEQHQGRKTIVDEWPPKGIGSSKYIYWLVVHLQKVDSLLSLIGRYSPSLIRFFLYTLTPHEVSPNHIPKPPPC